MLDPPGGVGPGYGIGSAGLVGNEFFLGDVFATLVVESFKNDTIQMQKGMLVIQS